MQINSHSLRQVHRDGQWQEKDAAVLVPGDIISIKLGDIIPADARLLEGDPLKIDQASSGRVKFQLLHLKFLTTSVSPPCYNQNSIYGPPQ